MLTLAQHVKAFVCYQKSDANDAAAICETKQPPRIHPVAIKSIEQQDIQSLRPMCSRMIDNRPALGNQIRGLCRSRSTIKFISISQYVAA